jgi:hypothetical protein
MVSTPGGLDGSLESLVEGRTCLDLELDHPNHQTTSQHCRDTIFTRLGLPFYCRWMLCLYCWTV